MSEEYLKLNADVTELMTKLLLKSIYYKEMRNVTTGELSEFFLEKSDLLKIICNDLATCLSKHEFLDSLYEYEELILGVGDET